MWSKPLALDLFCGGGGAAEGLIQAGFEVVGIDVRWSCRKSYPGHFIRGDALRPPVDLSRFDLIWASPPCQRYSLSTRSRGAGAVENHPDLIPPVRDLLAWHPLTIIENVPGSPLRIDCALTGEMVGLPRIQRLRYFELSFPPPLLPPPRKYTREEFVRNGCCTITTSMSSKSHFYYRKQQGLPGRVPVAEARAVMGITASLTGHDVGESVPPPYAKLLGDAAMTFIQDALRSPLPQKISHSSCKPS